MSVMSEAVMSEDVIISVSEGVMSEGVISKCE